MNKSIYGGGGAGAGAGAVDLKGIKLFQGQQLSQTCLNQTGRRVMSIGGPS
jgi:hypothetical protein